MIFQRVVGIVLALFLLCLTGEAQAVVGPSRAGSPIAASLVMVLNHSGSEAGFCTGVVLAPTTVMTAAHCVPPGAAVRIHFPDLGRAPVLFPVDRVTRHPDYRPDAIRTRQRSIDLALIHLPDPLPARFVPVSLSAASGATAGQRFTVSGYGLGREGNPASSGALRSATLAARRPLSALLLWADDPEGKGAGACTGDSGAPVMAEGASDVTAIAVWSAGKGRHQCGDLTQALWLAPLRGWIASILHDEGKP